MKRAASRLIFLSVMALLVVQEPARTVLVICAPGYPGNTEQAQETMDAFAAAAARGAGWPGEGLEAAYFETAEGGLERMERPDVGLAMVPLAFLIELGPRLGLKPRLVVVPEAGADEVWTLVAGRGLVGEPASLEGWELSARDGYAAGFVRKVVLGGWGKLPPSTRIGFTSRVLSDLRRAARGEKIAVLLDGEQSRALSSLPFAGDLEVVFESDPLPRSFLCLVGERMDEARSEELFKSLLGLHKKKEGAAVLEQIRVSRFRRASPELVERLERLREQASGSGS